MAYEIEEYFGDSYVKTSEAKTQKAALEKMKEIHQSNLKQKRKSGVRVIKDNVVVDCLETEKQAEAHGVQN